MSNQFTEQQYQVKNSTRSLSPSGGPLERGKEKDELEGTKETGRKKEIHQRHGAPRYLK